MNDEPEKPRLRHDPPWFIRASWKMELEAQSDDLEWWCRAYDPDMPLEGLDDSRVLYANLSWSRL